MCFNYKVYKPTNLTELQDPSLKDLHQGYKRGGDDSTKHLAETSGKLGQLFKICSTTEFWKLSLPNISRSHRTIS